MRSARNHVARDLMEGMSPSWSQLRRSLEDAEMAIASYQTWLVRVPLSPLFAHGQLLHGFPHGDCPEQDTFIALQQAALDPGGRP